MLLKVDLSNFFNDHRKIAIIRVDPSWKFVQDAQRHVSKLFQLPPINFLGVDGCFVPDMEDIEILTMLDSVKIFRIKNSSTASAAGSAARNAINKVETSPKGQTQSYSSTNANTFRTNKLVPKPAPLPKPAMQMPMVQVNLQEVPVSVGKRKSNEWFSNLVSSTPQTAKKKRCDFDVSEIGPESNNNQAGEQNVVIEAKAITAQPDAVVENHDEHNGIKKRRQRIRKRKSNNCNEDIDTAKDTAATLNTIASSAQHLHFKDDWDTNKPSKENSVILEMRSPLHENSNKKLRKFNIIRLPNTSVDTGVVITEEIIIPAPASTENVNGTGDDGIVSHASKSKNDKMDIAGVNVTQENHCAKNSEINEKTSEIISSFAGGCISKAATSQVAQNANRTAIEKTLTGEKEQTTASQKPEDGATKPLSKEITPIISTFEELQKEDVIEELKKGDAVEISQQDVPTFSNPTNPCANITNGTNKENTDCLVEKDETSIVQKENESTLTTDMSIDAAKEKSPASTSSSGAPIPVRVTSHAVTDIKEETMGEKSSIQKSQIPGNTKNSIELTDYSQQDNTNPSYTSFYFDDSKSESEEVIDLSDEDDEMDGSPSTSRCSRSRIVKRKTKSSLSLNEKTLAKKIATHGISHVMQFATKLTDLPEPDDYVIFKVCNPNRKNIKISNFIAGICRNVHRRLKKVSLVLIENQSEVENIPPNFFTALDESTDGDKRCLFIKFDDLIEPHVIKTS